MKKVHTFEFVDGSAVSSGKLHDGIEMSYSGGESLTFSDVDGVRMLSGNREGLIWLGQLLIQMGRSEYRPGFHIHLNENLDCDRPEMLIVGVAGKS